MDNNKIRHYIAKYAIVFIFLVFGIWELIDPGYWSAFVPSFLSNNALLLVRIHGTILSILAIWLAIGIYFRIAAVISSLIMLDIVVSLFISSGFSDLLVRDIVILLLAISLIFDDL